MKAHISRFAILFVIMTGFLFSSSRLFENGTIPGEITTPYPTIKCLAVEWMIHGDDNNNARVEVQYRAAGEKEWMKAMPLVRIPAGTTGKRTSPTYSWANKFSGSIFNLKSDTEYEIRLSLTDSDGGKATETVKAHTRPVPREAENARIIKVNAGNLEKAARCAQPGDVLLLSPGFYEDFTMPVDGEPGKPIVLRADRADPVVGSTFTSVNLEHRKNVIIDGLTVWGTVRLRWAENVAVCHCDVQAESGIVAQEQPGCKNCYIADNTVTYKIPWVNETTGSGSIWGGPGNIGEGIEITGPGNVICYNRVSGYRDCISLMEDLWVYDQICDDIYNNDISEGSDDAIEADFAMNNCRIMNNRITNCGMGLSSQPGLGGPTYFIRNVMYNLSMAPFKLERKSYGNLFINNTVVKSGDGLFAPHGQGEYFTTVWLNNLCIGGSGGGKRGRYSGGEGYAVGLPGYNATCSFDYNAVGTEGTPFEGVVGDRHFKTIEELEKLTGASHCIRVGMDVFASRVEFPDPVFPARKTQDLRIAASSAAVDAGVVLPNVNDDFTGKAPDIGAYEVGKPVPHYGPRTEKE